MNWSCTATCSVLFQPSEGFHNLYRTNNIHWLSFLCVLCWFLHIIQTLHFLELGPLLPSAFIMLYQLSKYHLEADDFQSCVCLQPSSSPKLQTPVLMASLTIPLGVLQTSKLIMSKMDWSPNLQPAAFYQPILSVSQWKSVFPVAQAKELFSHSWLFSFSHSLPLTVNN